MLDRMRARIVSAEESVDVVATSARRVADDVEAIKIMAAVVALVVALVATVVIADRIRP
jgi:hypothetical protein